MAKKSAIKEQTPEQKFVGGMREVRVIGFSATLGTGKVALTPGQAIPRLEAGLLAGTDEEGIYSVVGLISFKQGEVFGFDGEFSPTVLADMAPVEEAVELLSEAEAAAKAVKDARIEELEALGENITEDEQDELNTLLSE